jgi:hypothetical protein
VLERGDTTGYDHFTYDHLHAAVYPIMPNRTSKSGSDLFIVDNSDDDWKVH